MDMDTKHFLTLVIFVVMLVAVSVFTWNQGVSYGREFKELELKVHRYEISCVACESALEQVSKFNEALRQDLNAAIAVNQDLKMNR